MIGG
ncbi:hypothetical protein VCHC57A2_1949, partial [Vibrio cholerae HC-57A2]|jgi:hypothetical protein